MTTISQDVGRGDFLIHRGADESIASRWTENALDGRGEQPKDLSKWTADFIMEVGHKEVYRQSCITTSDGYAIANIPGLAFISDSWNSKVYGDWKILAYGPEGQRELLAWGAYVME